MQFKTSMNTKLESQTKPNALKVNQNIQLNKFTLRFIGIWWPLSLAVHTKTKNKFMETTKTLIIKLPQMIEARWWVGSLGKLPRMTQWGKLPWSSSSSPKMRSMKILPNNASSFNFRLQKHKFWSSLARVKLPPPRVSNTLQRTPKVNSFFLNDPPKKYPPKL